MRNRIVAIVAAGALGVGGLAVAGPALASGGATSAATGAATAVTSGVDRVKQALAGLVSDKTLTQAQADKVAATLGTMPMGPMGPMGRGGHRGPGGGPDLTAAATALKMTETDLRSKLESGKTLAQVAKDEGVSSDTLVAALVKAETDRITQDVTDKRITQAQADAFLADLRTRVTDRVNSTRPTGPRGDRAPDGGFDGPTGASASPSASASASTN